MDESGLPVRPDRVLLGEYSRHYGHAAANQLMLELSGPLLCWLFRFYRHRHFAGYTAGGAERAP